MLLKNGKILIDGAFQAADLAFDTHFSAIGALSGAADFDASGCYVLPGLVDIHTHGALGADAGDGDAVGLAQMSRAYAAHGVTAWCPTMVTLPEDKLMRAMEAVAAFSRPADGARCAGVHLEGPFLSAEKCGAQGKDFLRAPDVALFDRLNAASGGQICLVTVAPELPQAQDFIRAVSQRCTVSLGHSAADYDTAMSAYAAGASHTTHLFNAMSPLHHRAPALIGAAFDAGASAELICDGLHLHPAVVRMAFRLFGKRCVLVSDSLRCAGLSDGNYMLGAQAVTLRGGRATLTGTDTLAGSAIFLLDAVRNAVHFGVPLEAAATAATAAPAKVIGRSDSLGAIALGRDADCIVLDENLNLVAVFLGGKRIQ